MRSAALVSLFFVCILHSAASSAEQHRLRIGVIAAQTSPMGVVGTAVCNGIRLADAGLDKEDLVEFVFEDDAYQVQNSVSSARKLLDTGKLDGLIVFGSGPAIAVSEVTDRLGIPLLAVAMSDKVTRGKKNTFRLYITAETQNAAIGAEVKRRGYKHIALISTANEAMAALREPFLRDNGEIVAFKEEVLPGDVDIRIIAARLRALQPDAVYLLVVAPQFSAFSRQLREAGFKGDFFGALNLSNPAERVAADGALNGAWCVSNDDTLAGKFFEEYRRSFRDEPLPEAVNGYESAAVFIDAAGKGISSVLRPGAEREGLVGTYKMSRDNTFEIPAAIRVVTPNGLKNGQI